MYKIVNYHYSNIEQLHDNILKYIISDLIVSADTSQLYIIQSMLQHKDDVSSSWMEHIGFQSHNIYQQFLTDEYLYGIRDQLENVLNKVGLYFKNPHLFTCLWFSIIFRISSAVSADFSSKLQ